MKKLFEMIAKYGGTLEYLEKWKCWELRFRWHVCDTIIRIDRCLGADLFMYGNVDFDEAVLRELRDIEVQLEIKRNEIATKKIEDRS